MLPPSTAYSPTPIRATTPIREVKETRLQLFLYPPSLPPLFVSRSFLHGFPRCHHPVHPSPLFSQNLPRTQPLSSLFHLSRNPDERVYGITRNKAGFMCILKKCIDIHIFSKFFEISKEWKLSSSWKKSGSIFKSKISLFRVSFILKVLERTHDMNQDCQLLVLKYLITLWMILLVRDSHGS